MANQGIQFLPEDFEMLLKKIAELEQKITEAGQAMGEATEQSSETWHDNAPYDIARQNFENLTEELGQLLTIRNQAIIIDKPEDTQVISVGHLVTIEDEDGKRQKILLAGKMVK